MPKTHMDYSKTNIYKIVCNDLNVNGCYVGHTINMTKRKWNHKSNCNNEKSKDHNLKIYKIIRENGGWDNWNMVLVEKFPCIDKYEACKREREVYEELGAKLNMVRPYLTQEDHKAERKEYSKLYYQEHKAEFIQYREEHKAERNQYSKKYGKQYREEHKAEIKKYDKQYHEEHKAEIKQYRKQYYQEHKAELIEKMKEKIECEYCTKRLSKGNMPRHIKICKSK